MPESYPLSSHAASFWIAGDDLMVAFPGEREARGHTIRLPATAAGFSAAIAIMRDRAEAQRHSLSERGTPSQYEIERAMVRDQKYVHLLGAMARSKEIDQAAQAEAVLELKELGL